MNLEQNSLLQKIINMDSTQEKISSMYDNIDKLKDIQFILFDEKASNFRGFSDRDWGNYHLCGLGDYDKCWIIDGNNTNKLEAKVYRVAYFDINILARIDEYYRGKQISDIDNLLGLIDFLKKESFDIQIGNSIIERLSKQYDERLFKQELESYYNVLINRMDNNIGFDGFFKDCKNVGYLANNAVIQRQYNFLYAMMIKAILIKSDKNIKNKIDAMVEFCLNDLKCISINELYALCLYIEDNPLVKRTRIFAKFQFNISGGLKNAVQNSTWDIYHARLIEQDVKLYDINNSVVCLPYIISHDTGLKDYMRINPRKMIVIDNGRAIPIFEHNIGDIEKKIVDKKLYERIIDVREQDKRRAEIQSVDIAHIVIKLESELETLIKSVEAHNRENEQRKIIDKKVNDSGLNRNLIDEIRSMAKKYNIEKVTLFGSRARGDYKERSDIDLAFIGGNADKFILDVSEETNTLLSFDIVDLNRPVQKELLDSIEREGIVIYEKV